LISTSSVHIQELRDLNIAEKNNPNAVVISFYGYTVLSTILEPEPEPIAVAEDSSSGSSSCSIAVTAVAVGKKTSWQRQYNAG
jgi:hypothetical protein